MAYGIGNKTGVAEIDEWNSPEHWIRSDIQSAVQRGNIAGANELNKTLGTMEQSNTAAANNLSAQKVAGIGIQPAMAQVDIQNQLNPTGTDMFAQLMKQFAEYNKFSSALTATKPAEPKKVSMGFISGGAGTSYLGI